MLLFKCKMCGGTIEFEQGATVGVCDSCGTKQTLPKTSDDVIANLFNRANNLRLKCEFDKAEQIYEKIVQQDDSEAEAHWGIVLCKYGIEYVEDPVTGKRLPTCHRTLFDAVTADADYQAALDYSDTLQQTIYEAEARAIDHIQRDILSIVKNEKPFDVFICYKETDEDGKRTMDSAIANDIYYQLTQEGLKVFYAAITLEDKLGQEYEPYIFAALNSAKVMLVVGTKPEYFNAVWVKNEWGRYLKLMKTDRSKLLIPCYRDMDAYDLPEEFAHLQAQDMSKIGFINDVVRGIKKVITPTSSVPTASVATSPSEKTMDNNSVEPLLKRIALFLEDEEWNEANTYCEKVLDRDPENGRAYLGKLMAELHCRTSDDLVFVGKSLFENKNCQKVLRFGNKEDTEIIEGIRRIVEQNEAQVLAKLTAEAKEKEKEENERREHARKLLEEEAPQLLFKLKEWEYFPAAYDYVDVSCPHCDGDFSFTNEEIFCEEILCPECGETIVFSPEQIATARVEIIHSFVVPEDVDINSVVEKKKPKKIKRVLDQTIPMNPAWDRELSWMADEDIYEMYMDDAMYTPQKRQYCFLELLRRGYEEEM